MANQRTLTQTAVATRTKTVAAVGITLLAGLGAYGFGFFPGLEQNSFQERASACHEACVENQNFCKMNGKDPSLCQEAFQDCNQQCVEGEPENGVPVQEQDQPMVPSDQGEKNLPASLESEAGGLAEYHPPEEAAVATTTLYVRSRHHPVSKILVPQEDVWHPVAEYQASASTREDLFIDRLTLVNGFSTDTVAEVAVAESGRIIGRGFFPHGYGGQREIDFSSSPLRVPAGGEGVFQIWVKLNPLVHHSIRGPLASSLVPSAPEGWVGLLMDVAGEGRVVLHAYSADPRVFVRTPIPDRDSLNGNRFIVRKSRLEVRPLDVTNPLRPDTQVELYRVTLTREGTGAVGVKKMTFDLRARIDAGNRLQLSRFRVRRDGGEIPASQVQVIDRNGRNLLSASGSASTTLDLTENQQLTVVFTNEETINGAGHTYVLQARVAGQLSTGDELHTVFARTATSPSFTGYLGSSTGTFRTPEGMYLPGPYLDRSVPAGGGYASYAAALLWSDQLSPTHNGLIGTAGGSDDWASDAWLEDMNRVTVLRFSDGSQPTFVR